MTTAGAARLSHEERKLIVLLALPSAGLSACLTVLSTYMPVLAHSFTASSAVIGVLVGGEGLVGVLLPIWVGNLSDRTKLPWGPRIPFLLATAPAAAGALCLVPFARSLGVMAVGVFVFYLAYFGYYAPYRALYPDLLPDRVAGRAQGMQGVFNQAGLGGALVAGGFMMERWRPLPYLASAALLLVTTVAVAVELARERHRPRAAPARRCKSSGARCVRGPRFEASSWRTS